MTDATTRWGILATGAIARSFADDLRVTPGARLVAVGSRSTASAEAFVAEHAPGARAHGSYEALLADPDVDVVYVATPHSMHLDNARAALAAGKHVLCEKPLTLNTGDAERMIAAAREHDRFLMEAMWMACHPVVRAVREGLAAGRFGAPRQLHADIGFRVDRPAGDRLNDPALGGGALLDMGVYPLTLAQLLLGDPVRLSGAARLVDGIDRDVAIAGLYADGAVAALSASMTSSVPVRAWLATDAGRIDLEGSFFVPTGATYTPEEGEPVTIETVEPVLGTGYGNEAAHVGRCLAEGLRESPLVPHAQTLAVLRQMDDLRRQIGLTYPGE